MKKSILRVGALLLAVLLLLVSCAEQESSFYVSCEQDHSATRYYGWENEFYSNFFFYPEISYAIRYEIPHLTFDSCSDLCRKIEKKTFSWEERETLFMRENIGEQHEAPAILSMDEIYEVQFKGECVVDGVTWYGCSDYKMTCVAEFDGEEKRFFVHHPGYDTREENFEFEKKLSDAWQKETLKENDVEYTYYRSQSTNESRNNAYDREIRLWSFSHGGYTYRICERKLTERTSDGQNKEVYALACVEIQMASECFYLYFGLGEGNECPALTPETISEFTMRSVW